MVVSPTPSSESSSSVVIGETVGRTRSGTRSGGVGRTSGNETIGLLIRRVDRIRGDVLDRVDEGLEGLRGHRHVREVDGLSRVIAGRRAVLIGGGFIHV